MCFMATGVEMGLEIIGAGFNYKASKKAAKAQEEAAGQASEVAKESTDKQLELMLGHILIIKTLVQI